MVDIDEHGRPKAPIPGFPEPSPERLREFQRKREEVLAGRSGSGASLAVVTGASGSCSSTKKAVPFQSHMNHEEFDALGYPKVPEYMTPEWMRQQIEKERVDPRENANLLLDENEQEFWNNAARKPYAKVLLRTEQHWLDRKKLWLRQYERVEIMNQLREEVAEELEDCSPEVKRLVAPMLHYRICEVSLWNAVREARARQVPLSAVLEQREKLAELRGMRQRIDRGGPEAARAMMDEFAARADRLMADNQKQQDETSRTTRIVSDTDTVTKILNFGEKCKKDGYIEWHKGNAEEALVSWRQADEYLRKVKLPDQDVAGNKFITNMHNAILKNIAQAAIRLGNWAEALEASEDALRIDDQDPKAWFRRACALEGLGRFEEAEEALANIDDFAVGRPDRDRIQKDVASKRDRLRTLAARSTDSASRCLTRALVRGVFSEDRAALKLAGHVDVAVAGSAPEQSCQAAEGGGLADAQEPDAGDVGVASVANAGDVTGHRDGDAGRPASANFAEGDSVVVVEELADWPVGRRGAVVEIDEDGDARIRFEGSEEDELIFRMDFHHFEVDPSACVSTPSLRGPRHGDGGEGVGEECPTEHRLRLGKGAATELLEELITAYSDPALQKRVAKLARDVRWDRGLFVSKLRRVALEVQGPILARWGFEVSARGVTAMLLAVQDHTHGPDGDAALQARADEAARLLYGEMLGVLFPPHPSGADVTPQLGGPAVSATASPATEFGPALPPELRPPLARREKAIYGVG